VASRSSSFSIRKTTRPVAPRKRWWFRDAYDVFQERGAIILGVSPDDGASHVRFRDKYSLPYTLLADPAHEAADAYGAWGEKTSYGKTSMGIKRSTFVIAPDGTVAKAMYGVKPEGHPEQVLQALPPA
jgi:peroxiredoxin Q/BCP